ncbi:hypothetical protein EVAR_87824_1 [Eumeta japonica]|uniref:PiggyBac transposable element-derived protein domain-containing protein n=1 Tax=Eumeta variegata TaxID=151549 RepID=A0A4C1Z7F1_EUMVA|nr:hypothetical protein EVAR_87824_1 [Eumeta japonica]
MNSREIAQIEAWLAEDDSENEVFGDQPSSNEEEDHLEESDHQSESQQDGELPGETSADNSEPEKPPQRVRRTDFYAGVDGTMWSKTAPLNTGRTRSHNIVSVPPGPKGIARQKTAIPDCLSLFVDDNIIELLTKYLNIKIDYLKDKYSRQRNSNPTDHIEMIGYIGILLMAGVIKMSRLNTDQIFDHVKHTGIDAIYLTMSEQRFKFLTRALRFDNIEDRHDRAQPEGPFRLSNERHDMVMRMARPVLGKHLNITMDNWFPHNELLSNYLKMALQWSALCEETKEKYLVDFVLQEEILYSLPSLVSTNHTLWCCDHQKPEIITYYNRTKNGVDLVDKMCSLYDVSRNSRRWPVTVFYALLNLRALNALCIYTANKNYESVRRRDFLVDLSLAWMKLLANRRLEIKTLPRSLTFKIKDFLGIIHTGNESTASTSPSSKSVRRCHDYGRARSKSTRKYCSACKKFICGDHSKIGCPRRAESNRRDSCQKHFEANGCLFYGVNGHVRSDYRGVPLPRVAVSMRPRGERAVAEWNTASVFAEKNVAKRLWCERINVRSHRNIELRPGADRELLTSDVTDVITTSGPCDLTCSPRYEGSGLI